MRVNVISMTMQDGKAQVAVPSEETLREMSLSNLAALADKDWRSRGTVYFGAKPYLNAMLALDTLGDQYGLDSGEEIVIYFLSNAQSWRGELARAIKKELKRRLREGKA